MGNSNSSSRSRSVTAAGAKYLGSTSSSKNRHGFAKIGKRKRLWSDRDRNKAKSVDEDCQGDQTESSISPNHLEGLLGRSCTDGNDHCTPEIVESSDYFHELHSEFNDMSTSWSYSASFTMLVNEHQAEQPAYDNPINSIPKDLQDRRTSTLLDLYFDECDDEEEDNEPVERFQSLSDKPYNLKINACGQARARQLQHAVQNFTELSGGQPVNEEEGLMLIQELLGEVTAVEDYENETELATETNDFVAWETREPGEDLISEKEGHTVAGQSPLSRSNRRASSIFQTLQLEKEESQNVLKLVIEDDNEYYSENGSTRDSSSSMILNEESTTDNNISETIEPSHEDREHQLSQDDFINNDTSCNPLSREMTHDIQVEEDDEPQNLVDLTIENDCASMIQTVVDDSSSCFDISRGRHEVPNERMDLHPREKSYRYVESPYSTCEFNEIVLESNRDQAAFAIIDSSTTRSYVEQNHNRGDSIDSKFPLPVEAIHQEEPFDTAKSKHQNNEASMESSTSQRPPMTVYLPYEQKEEQHVIVVSEDEKTDKVPFDLSSDSRSQSRVGVCMNGRVSNSDLLDRLIKTPADYMESSLSFRETNDHLELVSQEIGESSWYLAKFNNRDIMRRASAPVRQPTTQFVGLLTPAEELFLDEEDDLSPENASQLIVNLRRRCREVETEVLFEKTLRARREQHLVKVVLRLRDRQQHIESNEKEISNLQAALEELQSQLPSLNGIQSLAENDSKHGQTSKLLIARHHTDELLDLRSDLENVRNALLQEQHNHRKIFEEQKAELDHCKRSYEGEIRRISGDLKAKDDECAYHAEQLESLQSKLLDSTARYDALESRHQVLDETMRSELSNRESQLCELSQKLNFAEMQLQQVQVELANCRIERESMSQQLTERLEEKSCELLVPNQIQRSGEFEQAPIVSCEASDVRHTLNERQLEQIRCEYECSLRNLQGEVDLKCSRILQLKARIEKLELQLSSKLNRVERGDSQTKKSCEAKETLRRSKERQEVMSQQMRRLGQEAVDKVNRLTGEHEAALDSMKKQIDANDGVIQLLNEKYDKELSILRFSHQKELEELRSQIKSRDDRINDLEQHSENMKRQEVITESCRRIKVSSESSHEKTAVQCDHDKLLLQMQWIAMEENYRTSSVMQEHQDSLDGLLHLIQRLREN